MSLSILQKGQAMKNETQIPENVLASFLTQPGEELILAIRKHWLVTFSPLLITFVLASIAMVAAYVLSFLFFSSVLLFISTVLTVLFITLSMTTKILVDWYFHLYILTTAKIVEICYKPFFSESTSGVLLDQVRCTEVDVQINGIINELLDLGNISITFDRPTHQEEFTFHQIKSPRKISNILSEFFNRSETNDQFVWYKNKQTPQARPQFHIRKELFRMPKIQMN